MIKKSIPFFTGIFLFWGAVSLQCQNIPEEAREHFVRGKTALELAKYPEDYQSALLEFLEASALAPDWADPFYQMGTIYEKQQKYADAMISYKNFSNLSQSENLKTEVQDKIYRLEYLLEQQLKPEEIIDILMQFPNWKKSGDENSFGYWLGASVEKLNENTVRIFGEYKKNGDDSLFFSCNETILIQGPKVQISWYSDQCAPKSCPIKFTMDIEIINKTRVKTTITQVVLPTKDDYWKRLVGTYYYHNEYVKPQKP